MRLDATDPACPEWRRYLFPCDCGDTTWLFFEWWQGDYSSYLAVVPTTWAPTRRARLRAAVRVLLGRRVENGDGVLLGHDDAERLRATLDEFLTE